MARRRPRWPLRGGFYKTQSGIPQKRFQNCHFKALYFHHEGMTVSFESSMASVHSTQSKRYLRFEWSIHAWGMTRRRNATAPTCSMRPNRRDGGTAAIAAVVVVFDCAAQETATSINKPRTHRPSRQTVSQSIHLNPTMEKIKEASAPSSYAFLSDILKRSTR